MTAFWLSSRRVLFRSPKQEKADVNTFGPVDPYFFSHRTDEPQLERATSHSEINQIDDWDSGLVYLPSMTT